MLKKTNFHKQKSVRFEVFFIGVFLAWLGYAAFGLSIMLDHVSVGGLLTIQNLGVFGDAFGALNTLFSGLAFAGVAYSIKLQREELEHVKEQARESELSNSRQKFESVFFQLLQIHLSHVESFSYGNSAGRRCFQTIEKDYFNQYYSRRPRSSNLSPVEFYEEFSRNHLQSQLGHYFLHLHHIMQHVDLSDKLNNEEKVFYTSLLRAQLDSHELVLLAINGISVHGRERFKHLIEKYSFLEQLPDACFIPIWVPGLLSFTSQETIEILFKDCLNQYLDPAFGNSEVWKKILGRA